MTGNFNSVIQTETPVLVDFYADWCQPCKVVTPILKDLKKELGDKIKIIKVDVDANRTVSARYNIKNIPTIMLFKEGEMLWQHAGVASLEQLKYVLSPHLQ